MALVTIQRSPSPSTDNDGAESSEDANDGRSPLRKRSRTPKEKLRHIFSTVRLINKLRPGLSESYFTVKGAALILPHNECTRKTTKKSHGGEMQHHLQAMLHILRPEDTIKIAIRLEDVVSNYHRYMALVSTKGRQDTEECVILGLDCSSSGASIGLVLPVWLGLKMKLGGDGGFSLYTDEHSYLFKPVSVQAMWSAIQSLVKVVNMAETMKYIHDGLTHTWVGYYKSRINHADQVHQGQWNIEGIEVFAPSSLVIKSDDENERIKLTISQKLKEVMMVVDLDEATSIMLRRAVEQKMGMSLTGFKSYFDEEVMRILGQMDEPSEILDFLYLGSEWNASNLEEIKAKGIGYILNVTKEIDNFFMGMLQYYNVRVLDVEESDLLKHWDKTYKFICKARNNQSKVLVHCKMGISRSASTVMAFLMKDRRWSVDEAYKFVKSKRSIVRPNDGFLEQLNMYGGILTASNKRDIFRSKSDQNLLDDANNKDDPEPIQGSFLGDSLFHVMSHSDWPMAASEGVAYEEEWIADLHAGRGMTPELMQMDGDLEAAEARSADSMDDVIADELKPTEVHQESTVSDSQQVCLRCTEEQTVGATAGSKEGKSSSAPPFVDGFSLGEDSGTGGRSSASLRSIKPDSSWIRPASLELGPDVGESSIDDVFTNGASESAPCTVATGPTFATSDLIEEDINQHQGQGAQSDSPCASLTLHGATETESNDTPMVSETLPASAYEKTQMAFHGISAQAAALQSENKTVDIQKSTAEASDMDAESKLCNMSSMPIGHNTVSVNDSSLKSPNDNDNTNTSPKHAESASENKPKIEMGVRQYFFREKIPWSPGKVQKMREGINKTGHLVTEDEFEDGGGTGQEIAVEPSQGVDLQGENLLSSPPYGMSKSRSCMELGSITGASSDRCAEGLTLYEKEEIPLEPGTVLRTRKEIEERHRFPTERVEDEGGERASYPVLRTSSLKQDSFSPRCAKGNNSRWSAGPPNSLCFSAGSKRRSLDDLRTVGVGEIDSSQSIEALKSSFVGQRAADNCGVTMETKGATAGNNEGPQSPRPKGNLDTDTLALIREIGSALLMSPSTTSPREISADGENNTTIEPCSNMVKYFVTKIEQQQQQQQPVSPDPTTEIHGPHLMAGKDLSAQVQCLNKTRPPVLQDPVYAKTSPIFSSGGDRRCSNNTHEENTTAPFINEQRLDIARGSAGLQEHASSCSREGQVDEVCCDKAQQLMSEPVLAEDDHPEVFESPAQTPGEENSPTVRHLVGKFESGQTADMPCASSYLVESNQEKSASLQPDSCSSSPTAKNITTSIASLGSTVPLTSTSPCSTQGGSTLTAPTHPPKGNMPDCDIPVEIHELSSSSPGNAQLQKRTATSPHTSPPSFVRSLGPQPFSKKNLEMSRECRSWWSVQPKSASDQPGQRSTSLHHHRTGSADFDQSCLQEGMSRKAGDTEVAFRHSFGEEGRKKRRLHGKSLPIPPTFRVGEEQEQQQQQKPKLGQGPFYSSM